MAEFITTQGASYQIEQIIKGAKQFVFLISPYLKFSKTFFERLELADSKGVGITIVYGKTDLSNSESNRLNSLKNLKIYYCHELHAKCYFNEEQMVITSMNLYEYSQVNNREMGISIRKSEDKTLYEDAFEEAQAIIRISESQHKEEILEEVVLGNAIRVQKNTNQESEDSLIYFENGEYSFKQSVPQSIYRILVNRFGTDSLFEVHKSMFKYSFSFSINNYPIRDITWNFHENAYQTIEFEDLQEFRDFEVHQPEMVTMFPNYSMNWGKYQINIRRTLGGMNKTEELLHEVVQTQLKMFDQFNEMLSSKIQRPL